MVVARGGAGRAVLRGAELQFFKMKACVPTHSVNRLHITDCTCTTVKMANYMLRGVFQAVTKRVLKSDYGISDNVLTLSNSSCPIRQVDTAWYLINVR